MHTRTPTEQEIADAYRYIDREYMVEDGRIDGEQWAEGLAFALYRGSEHELAIAREVRPQLTDDQWRVIAARADYLRLDQCLGPLFDAPVASLDSIQPGEEPEITTPRTLAEDRAVALATSLRELGHNTRAFAEYGDRISVGCDITHGGRWWVRVISFALDGSLMSSANGSRGNPWRHGAEHDAVESAANLIPVRWECAA